MTRGFFWAGWWFFVGDYSYVSNESNIYRKTFGHRGGGPYNEYTYDDLGRLTAFVITIRIVRSLIWMMLAIELVIGLCGRKGCVIFEYSNGNGEDKIKKTSGRSKTSTINGTRSLKFTLIT